MIPYSRQKITKQNIKDVVSVLNSDLITQGPVVKKFENALKNYTNSKYCKVMSNGTAALHAACFALNLNNNDIVWTSPISFVASANCASFFGAKLNFIDIDAENGLIDVKILEKRLLYAKKNKCLPKILIIVHFAGEPCNLKYIYKLSKTYKFKVIEDASHALGAIYNKTKIGSCKYSDITTFSFHPVKNITTGEGGAITTNNLIYKSKIEKFISHGINKNRNQSNSWEYNMEFLGYNYRMTEIQAALGIGQLSVIEQFIRKKKLIKDSYDNFFKKISVETLKCDKKNRSANHLYVIKLKNKTQRKKLYEFLLKHKIKSQIHYIPIFLHSYYLHRAKYFDCKESKKYYDTCLSIPFYQSLKLKEIKYIKNIIKKFFDI